MVQSPKKSRIIFKIHSTWRRKLVVWAMLILTTTQPVLTSAEVIVDSKASGGNRPVVENAANGVPIVQITTPSASGVSRNFYHQFNVDPRGLILNNSQLIAQTQLAGYITGNPNLTNGSARLILNEVTGNNPSYLRGYTEVAGRKAEVIIANPSGIYGDGFGFINTSRAVLTTGTPVFGGSGSLEAFRVTGGQISIQGAGMNATDVDQMDLISRFVAINAGVWAKKLNVVTGSNKVDYNTLQTETISGDANTSQVAIDVGELGGMYAQKIYLVGTENGVGVNSKGTIAAQAGDIIITNAGKVLLIGNTLAAGDIKIVAGGDVANKNTLYTQGNISIATQGILENNGTIAAGQHTTLNAQRITSIGTLGAGVQTDGTLGLVGELTINTAGAMLVRGQNMVAGNLAVHGTEIDLANSKSFVGGNANLTATVGDIDHSGGIIQVAGSLNANAQGVIRNDNGAISTKKLTLYANSIRNRNGEMLQFGQEATTITAINTVDNTGGTVITNGNSLIIQAGSLTNSQGQIQHAGNGILIAQTTADSNNDNGKVATNGYLQLSADNMDNTQGTIVARGIDLTANGTLRNKQGTIASSVDLIRINVQGNIANEQGSIEANKGLEVIGQSLDNQKGRLVSLDTSGLKVTVVQDIQNQSGLIGGNGDIDLTASSFANSLGQIIAQGSIKGNISQNIDNSSGNIAAQQNVTLGQRTTNVNNTQQGTISAGSNMAVMANRMDNTNGNLIASQDIDIHAGTMTAGGKALAGRDLKLTVTNDLRYGTNGDFKANRNINIAADAFSHKGSLSAVGDINLNVNSITNDTGSKVIGNGNLNILATGHVANYGIMAGSTTRINAENITNSGSLVADQLIITAGNLFNTGNTAAITTNQSADFTVRTVMSNTDGANIYSNGTTDTGLTIKTSSLNNSGVIASGGDTTITAQTIQSSGTIGAGINRDGTLGTGGNLDLTATNAIIATGNNLAAGSITAKTQDINLIGAKTLAGKDIHLVATIGNINNTGAALQANGTITLQAANALYNDQDAAGHAAHIQARTIAINAIDISNVGGRIIQFGSEDTNITANKKINNTNGSIVTNGKNLTIKANTLISSQSHIIHAGTNALNITTTSLNNNNGATIQSNGNININTRDFDNIKGTVTTLQGIEITSNTLMNDQGTLAASGEVIINIENGVSNQKGIIEAGKSLTMNVQSINNNEGSITSLDIGGMAVNAVQGIDNTAGTIGGNGDVNLTGQSLVNTQGKIIAQGNINGNIADSIDNFHGTISAQQHVTMGKMGTNTIANLQGKMTAGANLSVQANNLSNTGGTIAANKDITLTVNVINGTGNVTAGQDLNFTTNNDFVYSADNNLKANRDLNITAANVTNSGSLAAVRNFNIRANNVTNNANATLQGGAELNIDATGNITNSGTMEGNIANIKGQNIVNTGSVFGDNLTMMADTILNNGNTAVIGATQNINLFAKTSVENKEDASIYSMGNINIAGSKNQDGNGEYLDKMISVLNQSATIEADGNIGIYAGTLTNKMREYEITKTVVSEAQYMSGVRDTWYDGVHLYAIDKTYPIYPTYPGMALVILLKDGKGTSSDPKLFLVGETVTETSVIAKSSVGKIMAANNMKLRTDSTNNDMGWIIANGTLGTVGTINNTALGATRTTTRQIVYATESFSSTGMIAGTDEQSGLIFTDGKRYNFFDSAEMYYAMDYAIGKSYNEDTTEQIAGGALSLFGGGKQVTIQGGSVNNTTITATNVPITMVNNIASSGVNQSIGTVKDGNINSQTTAIQAASGYSAVTTSSIPIGNMQTLLPKAQNQSVASAQTSGNTNSQTTTVQTGSTITLPTNGMFKIHKEPTSQYLVETNSRFTSYDNFISSDYMLQQISVDPAKTMKRLGDGFYEQKLVREQITDLTGRYYLNNYSSAEQQYKALMDNGVTYAKELNLGIGVALTDEQMVQLTSDLVWMVEREVDGQKVLVPQVYLARSGNIILKANGAVIAADNIQIATSGDVNNAGIIKATESVNIQAVNIANYGGIIDGGTSTQLTAGQNIVNFGGTINGDQTQLIAGKDIKNETISFTSTLPFMTRTSVGNVASINADQNLVVQAGGDISITGAQVNARQNIALTAGGIFTVDSVKEQDRIAVGSYLKDNVSNLVSTITAGNHVNIISMGDITLRGAQVIAGSDLTLLTSGNITVSAVKDENIHNQTVGINHGWRRTRTDDETVIGSTLQGAGQITVAAVQLPNTSSVTVPQQDRGNITIEGSTINSTTGEVTIAGDNDVTIKEVTEKHESLVQTHKKKSGFLSSKTTDILDHDLVNQVEGSTISGDKVTIFSGNGLTMQGSNVVGTNDVALTATNDINIISTKETGNDEHYSYSKTSGLFSGGGLGFTIGSKSEKITTNEQTLGKIGSTIGSINGNVSITAGDKVNSAGTTFVAGQDLTIIGKDVTIDNTINTVDSQSKYEFKQSGLTVSLGGDVVTAATNAAGDIKRSSAVEDERLKALYDYKAAQDIKKLGDSKGDLKAGVTVNVSIGSSKKASEQIAHTETVNTSNLSAGGNVNITATDGDVSLKGTNIKGTDINVDAAKDINIDGAENKQQLDSKTSSSSWAVGGTIGTGYFANASKGSGKENENAVINTGSVIDASGTLKLKSGDDTNIIGSEVKGEKVVADIGGNLNIASKQDTDNYTAKNQNSGFGISTGSTGGMTGSLGTGKTDSTYASVNEQAGIFAGKEGFDITVGKNTDLKGAVIASEAEAVKNAISTSTLTFANMENRAKYNSSSIGVNLNTTKDAKLNEKGITPNIGVTASGDANSTTKSAIAPGTITITGNQTQDISKLSRDPSGSLNALGKIFDKKTVQEQQELAKVFGEEAFKAIGDLGLKEGSPEKVALDAFAGGLMAKLGGGNFASGATGAGFNQLVINELKNIKNPAVLQWASAVVGAVAAKVVGGNAQTGASTAVSETKNNLLKHEQQRQKLEELSMCKNQEEKDAVNAKWDKLSDEQIENPNIEVPGTVVYDKDNSKVYIDGNMEPVSVTAEKPKYSFDLKTIWDYTAGLGRGILGVPNLPGNDYSDKSNAFKYGYSVGNTAMPLALQFDGLGKFNPFSASPEFAVGYNGTLAQTTAVDAWKVGSAGSTVINASTNNPNSGGSKKDSTASTEGSSKAEIKVTFRNIPEGGATITGRKYTEHALERMAPNTPEIRAELRTKYDKIAEEKGLVPGSIEYNNFINKNIEPRGITPTVVEDAIKNTKPTDGNTAGTFVHENENVKVIVNGNGDVITVIPR